MLSVLNRNAAAIFRSARQYSKICRRLVCASLCFCAGQEALSLRRAWGLSRPSNNQVSNCNCRAQVDNDWAEVQLLNTRLVSESQMGRLVSQGRGRQRFGANNDAESGDSYPL